MSRRQPKKHREHTRKPLTDARKQELFAQILAEAQGERKTVVEADEEDLKVLRADDADLEHEVAEIEAANTRSIWRRLCSWLPFRGMRE